MKWALVCDVSMNINLPDYSTGNCTWVSTNVPAGTIVNEIVYDGVTSYSSPTDCTLKQVPDTANIGDSGY